MVASFATRYMITPASMSDQRETRKAFHSNNITQWTAKDHGKCEAPKCRAEYPAKFFIRQMKLSSPYECERGPKGKRHSSYNQCNAAGQKKLFTVNEYPCSSIFFMLIVKEQSLNTMIQCESFISASL